MEPKSEWRERPLGPSEENAEIILQDPAIPHAERPAVTRIAIQQYTDNLVTLYGVAKHLPQIEHDPLFEEIRMTEGDIRKYVQSKLDFHKQHTSAQSEYGVRHILRTVALQLDHAIDAVGPEKALKAMQLTAVKRTFNASKGQQPQLKF